MDEDRDLCLDDVIRLEGRGVLTDDHCELCRKEGKFRCVDCVAVQFLCKECISSVHSFNPFHVIEVCSCVFFELFCAVLTRR